MRVLVTGGAGFIGSAVVRQLIDSGHAVLNVDCLTYAGTLTSLRAVAGNPLYRFARTDIRDEPALGRLVAEFRPDAIIHLAAESHVDRSITGARGFVETNIIGTFNVLEAARAYWSRLPSPAADAFRVVCVSTDEVYGALGPDGLFDEETRYDPSSPYAATKAAADHLASAWHRTYGLPVIITNCSNNYGPYHFPEKLIPLVILNAIHGEPLPVYGNGRHVRDWLFVDDHAQALARVMERGEVGQKYNIGGRNERTNLEVVQTICAILDTVRPSGAPHDRLINFVADRPGHDKRYAIDPTRVEADLGWRAAESFDSGIARTVAWYLENEWWWRPLRDGVYQGERLGLLPAFDAAS